MIPRGLFTQIAMIGLSIGIFITYIQPTFGKVESTQDQIAVYEAERQKVSTVTARLNELADKAKVLSVVDRDDLDTFLPSEVDTIAVQRDVLFIAEEAEVVVDTISSDSKATQPAPAEGEAVRRSVLEPVTISFGVTGSYEQIKALLALLERNNYPLYVQMLTMDGATANAEDEDDTSAAVAATTDPDAMKAEVTLVTYGLSLPDESADTI